MICERLTSINNHRIYIYIYTSYGIYACLPELWNPSHLIRELLTISDVSEFSSSSTLL